MGPALVMLAATLAGPPMAGGEMRASVPAPRIAPAKAKLGVQPEGPGGITLGRKAKPSKRSPKSTSHGMHMRSGIVIVPSFVLGRYFETYGNALCRGEGLATGFAAEQGTNRVGGCNYFIEGGYRMKKRNFVLQASLGYTKLFMPQSVWLGKGEDLDSADLTEIRMHVATGQIDLIGEVPVTRRLQWRFGASLGMGLLFGGIYRTKLGTQLDGCTLGTTGDLRQCRPYRAQEFDEPWREQKGFADCTAGKCSEADLIRAGQTKDTLPSLIPVGRLFTGPRYEIADKVGIAADVGIGVGVTFGLSLDAKFGR